MPTWRTELPPEGAARGYDLKRTPQSQTLIAIVTCEDMTVCDTHYWNARTTPCERECNAEGKTIDDSHCPACLAKAAWRTHVYVSVFDAKKREHVIFECTTHAAKPLNEYRNTVGTLRGCIINACRPKQTPNGKVQIMTHAADLSKLTLPAAPSIPDALAVIWRLPRKALDLNNEAIDNMPHAESRRPRAAHIRTRAAPLREMREQPDNACDPPTIGDIVKGNGQALKVPSHA